MELVYVSDSDVWGQCPTEWLWIYDKLIVAKKQGLVTGPAGVPVPTAGEYIVRPITNIRMMSRGATQMWLTPDDTDCVLDGYFWVEKLKGRHLSVDYRWGVQHLAVEGFRSNHRLDRFSMWQKVPDVVEYPTILQGLNVEWVNIEMIGDAIIEIHLRYNDDFRNHNSAVVIPVWKGETIPQPEGYKWYPSPAGERLGLWVKL